MPRAAENAHRVAPRRLAPRRCRTCRSTDARAHPLFAALRDYDTRHRCQPCRPAASVPVAQSASSDRASRAPCIIPHYAHRDRRGPCGVRVEAAPDRDAAAARSRGGRSRHAQRRRRWTTRRSAPMWRAQVAAGRADRGIVIGGSGQGEQMPPTRCRARAPRSATISTRRGLSREHNDANVLALGGRIVAHGAGRRDSRRCGSTRRSRADAISAASIRLPRSNVSARREHAALATTQHVVHRAAGCRGEGHHDHEDRNSDPLAIARGDRSGDRGGDCERAAPPEQRSGADRLGELRQPGGARGRRIGADEQVRRGVSREALLRRVRVRRRRRVAGDRAREAAVRRRARQRAAALRRPGEHVGLLHAAQAGRHGARDEPRARRPSHARPSAQFFRQALHDRALRRAPGRSSASTTTSSSGSRTSTSRR